GFSSLGETIEQMARRELTRAEQLRFAEQALEIRYCQGHRAPFMPDVILAPRRPADLGNDLWHVYNVVQEHLMQGGDAGRTVTGRSVRSRRLTSIREDVRINTTLWQLAMRLIRGE